MSNGDSVFPVDKTVIVTGGASLRGIGRATCKRFARDGWTIAILDLDEDGAKKFAEELEDSFGIDALGLGANIAEYSSVDKALERIERNCPPVVGLTNCAGISEPTPFLELSPAVWERTLHVNATGTFNVTHRVAEGMVARGVGRIVSLSSTAAQNGGGTYSKAAYAASKAAIEGMTRSVALELAPFGVTANSVAPATIDTDIMGGPLTEERKKTFLEQLPVGRVGTTDEVAALIHFLSGENAGYITGSTFNINGGIRIG